MSFDVNVLAQGGTSDTWHGHSLRSFYEYFENLPDGAWALVQTDGHDWLGAAICYRKSGKIVWCEINLAPTIVQPDETAQQILHHLLKTRRW